MDISDTHSGSTIEHIVSAAVKNAAAILHLTSLILNSHCMYEYILSFIDPLHIALQKTSCDLLKAHTNAHLCLDALRAQHTEDKFQNCLQGLELML